VARRLKVPIVIVAPQSTQLTSILTFSSVHQRDKAYRQLINHGVLKSTNEKGEPQFIVLGKVAVGFMTNEYVFPVIKESKDGISTSDKIKETRDSMAGKS